MSWPWLAFGRALAVGGLAGLPTGMLILGFGSRVAMRLSAVVAKPSAHGMETEAGAIVGEITLEGTVFLVSAGGMVGVLLGFLYMAIRRWMPHRGVVYGAFLMLTASGRLISDENIDFEILGKPLLIIPLFLVLGLLFGLAFVPLAETIERRLPRKPKGVFLALFYTAPVVLFVLVLISFGVNLELPGFVLAAGIIAIIALRRYRPALVRSVGMDNAMRLGLILVSVAGAVVLVVDTVGILRA